MSKILITGGAGFLGASLANKLSADGHEVRVIDDLTTGNQSALNPDIYFTRGDVRDIPKLWSLLQDVDCVYHMAARVSVAESMLYPRDYNDVNTGGTVSLMEAMRDAGIKRVVLASSGSVYGHQAAQPVAESAKPDPDSPYAVSKLAAEQYIETIGKLWEIETVALRIFNTYGPNQNLPASHAPVVPRFLQQAISGGSIVTYGDGTQSRDFVYISDVTNALATAATAPEINRKVINIGSGIDTSIIELVRAIEVLVGHKVNVINNADKGGGVHQLRADIQCAKALLNYEPQISLEAGLQQTLLQDERFKAFA